MPLYQPPLEIDWSAIGGKPATFPPDAHSHDWSAIGGKPATFPPDAHSHDWSAIGGKPATFPPDAHSHDWSTIGSKPALQNLPISVSSTTPVNPNVGNIWYEMNSQNNNLIKQWWWDGSRWRSVQDFRKEPSYTQVGGTAIYTFSFKEFATKYNSYLVGIYGALDGLVTNNQTSYWKISLSRMSKSQGATAIATFNTQGASPNTFEDYSVDLNILIDAANINVFAYQLTFEKVNAPGNLLGVPVLQYQLVRV